MQHTATLPKLVRLMRGLVPIAVLATLAAPAQGQAINYFTQGYFTSSFAPCNQTAPLVSAGMVGNTCTGGGFTLQYLPTSGVNIGSGSITSLGQFLLTGTGSATVPPGVLDFTLLVNQTTPTVGQAVFMGAITGSVSTLNGNTSSLIWTPNQFQTVGSTQYEVIYDNVGPAAGSGLGIPINNQRGIDALVTTTTTPEPASASLMATGLIGLVGMVRRRKRVVEA